MMALQMNVEPDGDAELMRRIVAGDEVAFRALYRRFAPAVRAIAVRALSPAAADDVLQEVFVRVWSRSETYDPSRGRLDAWIHQIARNCTRNRLRGAAEGDELAEFVDPKPLADEAHWDAFRAQAVHSALDALPEAQRRALRLAFLDELTHEEVARALDVPLGTAKTRIRSGLRAMSVKLGAVLAIALAIGAGWWVRRREALEHDALVVATSSDVAPLRLSAEPGMPSEAHATYRARPGHDVAVMTVTALPAGEYEAWAVIDGVTVRLGAVELDGRGRALLVARDARLSRTPTEIFVTRIEGGARVLSFRAR